MHPGRLYNSAAFRLTLLYILTFGASVAVLLVFIYSTFTKEIDRQIKYDINIQRADLGRKFIIDGPVETAAAIRHLVKEDKRGTLLLMLIDPDWYVMAGNIDRWPGGDTKAVDWVSIPAESEGAKQGMKAIAISSALPGGYILLVGRTLRAQEKIRKLVSDMLFICFTITGFLAAAGGLFMSRMIRKRLEKVNAVCATVMQGTLEARVPVTGSDDEFDNLAYNINRMLTRIEELIEGVRDISYNVAHDLRTPLNRLRNRVETIIHADMPAGQGEEQLRACLAEIDDLVATFNAILRISQAESGAGIEHFTRCDIGQLLSNVVELYRAVAEDKPIEIHMRWDGKFEVMGDKHLLSQAFANLLDNAIKYTGAGGEVTVSVSASKGYVTVSVADNGPGIPADSMDKVTQKFFRLESSRSTPGNGLGLSLVDAAVKLHGAVMTLSDNQPGLKVEITFDEA